MTEQIRNARRKIELFEDAGFFSNLDTAMRLAASVIEDAEDNSEMTPELRGALAAWGEEVVE